MRRIILALVISAAFGLGIAAWAQDNSYPSGTSGNATTQNSMSSETASGTVVSTDSRNITVRTDSGQQMSFTIDPSSSGIPSNVRTGSRVNVTYTTSADGTYRASDVMLSSDPGSSSTGSSSSSSGSTSGSGMNKSSSMSGTTESSGATSASESEHLPRTASPLPLIGITGLIALGGALAFRLSQRS